MNPLEVVTRFVERINAGDVDGIADLMTPDHVFIDSTGDVFLGRQRMRQGWAEYFRIVPDYRVDLMETYPNGPVVVLLGTAGGSYSKEGEVREENHWSTPAAWRARVEAGRIAEWRVYADNEPIRKLMRESPSPP